MRNPPLSAMNAVLASLLTSNSRRAASSSETSSSISWGSVPIELRVLRLALIDELVEQHAGDHVQSLEHAFALVGAAGKGRHLNLTIVQQEIHVFHWRDIRQIALVVLEHIRNVINVELQALQVILKILEALDVLGHLVVLRVGHE